MLAGNSTRAAADRRVRDLSMRVAKRKNDGWEPGKLVRYGKDALLRSRQPPWSSAPRDETRTRTAEFAKSVACQSTLFALQSKML